MAPVPGDLKSIFIPPPRPPRGVRPPPPRPESFKVKVIIRTIMQKFREIKEDTLKILKKCFQAMNRVFVEAQIPGLNEENIILAQERLDAVL